MKTIKIRRLLTAALALLLALSGIPARSAIAASTVSNKNPYSFTDSTSTTYVAEVPEYKDVGKDASELPGPYNAPFDGALPTVTFGSDGFVVDVSYEMAPVNPSVTTKIQLTAVDASADGLIGWLRIPAIGVSQRVYEGETLANLAKGAGHFTGTSQWDGNVGICGHNRGSNGIFGDIHTLRSGDRVYYETSRGTRVYEVYFVGRISETDWSRLAWSSENIITLITCVRDVPELRCCVQAREVAP